MSDLASSVATAIKEEDPGNCEGSQYLKALMISAQLTKEFSVAFPPAHESESEELLPGNRPDMQFNENGEELTTMMRWGILGQAHDDELATLQLDMENADKRRDYRAMVHTFERIRAHYRANLATRLVHPGRYLISTRQGREEARKASKYIPYLSDDDALEFTGRSHKLDRSYLITLKSVDEVLSFFKRFDANRQMGSHHLQQNLKVEFTSESGVDLGGVSRQFFDRLSTDLQGSPDFLSFEDTSLIGFSMFGSPAIYENLGFFMALSLHNKINFPLNLPKVYYKFLLDEPVHFLDLMELGYESLVATYIETYDRPDWRDYLATIGDMEKDVVNVFASPLDYVLFQATLIAKTKVLEAVQPQLEAWRRGWQLFYHVPPHEPDSKPAWEALQQFGGERLQQMFWSESELSDVMVDDLVDSISFSSDNPRVRHVEDSARIREFLRTFLHGANSKLRLRLLWFWTASSRVPTEFQGFRSVEPGMKIHLRPIFDEDPTSHLPVAHTCFNSMEVPVYASQEEFKEKLTLAVLNTNGMHIG